MFLSFKTDLISNLRLIICIFAVVSLNSKVLLLAADWPQYLGPNRNAIYPDKALTKTWPANGPKVIWKKKDIGEGLCGLVISGEKAILFHEIERRDVIECLNTKTGKSIWSNQYITNFTDSFGSGEFGFWWSSSTNGSYASGLYLSSVGQGLNDDYNVGYGFSVRCVRD